MKLQFTEAESLRVLNRVTWTVYVEVIVDGEVVLCTPHKDADELISNLILTTKRVNDETTPCPLAPHIEMIEVCHRDETPRLDTQTEIQVVMWGVVDHDTSKVIEWRGFLSPVDFEVQRFDVIDDTTCALSLPMNGYAVARAIYSRATPRSLLGVKITFNAVGVQRALDEFIL